jgi:type IV pilus assembly protein PilQ
MMKRKWGTLASLLAATGLVAVACGSQVAGTKKDAEPSVKPQAVVKNVEVEEKEGAVVVRVKTDRKVTYSLYQQEDPLRLVLDLPRTATGDIERHIPVNSGTVSFIRPETTDRGDSRLELLLTGESLYEISGKGNLVVLTVKPSPTEELPGLGGAPAAIVEDTPTLRDEPIESRAIGGPEKATVLAKATAGEAPPPAESASGEAAFITALDIRKDAGGALASIKGDGPLQYEYFLVEEKSLVVDIFSVGNKVWPTVRKVDGDFIEQVRIGEHFQPDKKVRVVFDLKKPGDYTVSKAASRIDIAFGSPSAETTAAVEAAVESAAAVTVSEVYFRPLEGKSRIEVKTSAKPEFKVVDSQDPLRIVVDISNATIVSEAEKTLDLSKLDRPVTKISAFQYKRDESPIVRIIAMLGSEVPFRVTAGGEQIVIDVNGEGAAEAASDAAPVAETARPEGAGTPVQPSRMDTDDMAKLIAAQQEGPKVYTGKHLSLDFMDAEVNDILRIIASVSGLNFVAGPEVKGKVSIRLADVPWDQALDIILKTNIPPLAQIQESDTIVRITTLSKIQEGQEAKRKAAEQAIKNREAQKKLEPLVTKKFQISYADVKDLEKVVKQFTSARVDSDGLLTVDNRTNTIIVRDLQENVDEIAQTIAALDSPTPAVVVEARIVEVTSDFSQELGVQWNVDFNADPSHGNALPVTFPNSIGLTGGVGDAETGSNYMVSLPAAGATSGIGLSFGHIANTLSLDLRLQAAQGMSKVKILSTPRVLVVQNEEAKINVGQELPIPSTDAEGNRTIEWRDVGISLAVTPTVTNDQRVFMDIKVAKESQGPPDATTDGVMFSIISRKAETQVLIGDGETAVIGGLAIEGTQEGEQNVPGLSKIPGLGWLFKSTNELTQRDELMIFLTPKIVHVM